jgi:predicted nuclease of predicted toxin-antitoxin system
MDENVSNAIADGLRRRGIDVTTTPEEGMISASDQEQLVFALSQERVIFTQDADFLRLDRSGVNHAGIVYCSQGNCSTGDIIRRLVLIWEVLEPEDIFGCVEFL